MFNLERLELARKRRRLTAKTLAEAAGVAPVTLSRIVNGKQTADPDTIEKLISALGFPTAFFVKDVADHVQSEAASFRSLTAMTARERDAALAAGSIAYEIADWLADRYRLPEADLPDVGEDCSPAAAAHAVRTRWQIGERPIGNLVRMLEARGVRVFSLSENTKNVDAFSVWRDVEPYVFLNTFKTAERSRFDAAHELGHLVLHRHGGPDQKQAEAEANAFAAAFLMPEADVRSQIGYVNSLDQIIRAKQRWGVSVGALAYRLHKLGLITDWQHRTFCIQINQRYRTTEPNGLATETSAIWQTALADLWREGKTRSDIAADLSLPAQEVDNLLFSLASEQQMPERPAGKPSLRIVS